MMKRCVSYKGQFVSDGKDPLRARLDHHAYSIGGANQFLGGFLFFGRLEIQYPRPDLDDDLTRFHIESPRPVSVRSIFA